MTGETPNRLVREKSPYLQKHAYNPVGWYPWGKEAFGKARNDGKPIFLSIGYSTCHWCTVMSRESFEDEKVAAVINKNFIPVKVDREERPEVDAYYMQSVQAMTGRGGWPLTVFLTPDLKPFYGGTYFPPEARLGMPSLMQVLDFVAGLWKEKRGEVVSNSEEVLRAVTEQSKVVPAGVERSAIEDGYSELVSSFDSAHGGFGAAPKFPLPGSLSFLLRYHFRTGKSLALASVTKTLDEMMAGGIRDHIGGGFHRYSTDRVWLVPHFEKMLYDNALLARVYAEAYQLTKKEPYAEVVKETLGWMKREMKDSGGGFYSAQDADTEEGEGIYYTWTADEIANSIGTEEGKVFGRLYGVTATGNYESRSLLHLDPGHVPTKEETAVAAAAKPVLREARARRPRPATDDKVLTSWNGLAISAFAYSSQVLKEPSLAEEAADAAKFVLEKVSEEGSLKRRFARGETALEGTLEDYAYFAQGLLDLFEATGEPRWLQEAVRLTDSLARFEDAEDGGFYLTVDAEPVKMKEGYDGPTPSGNSVAALNLARLAEITGKATYRDLAERTARAFGSDVAERPTAHTGMLVAIDLLLNGAREVVVTAHNRREAEPMVGAVNEGYFPDKVVVVATAGEFDALSKLTPLLEGREPGPRPRAYVCRRFTCEKPADSAEELRSQLAAR